MKRFVEYIIHQADDDDYWRDEKHREDIIEDFERLMNEEMHSDIYFTIKNPNFSAIFDDTLKQLHKSINYQGDNPWQIRNYIETGIHLGGSFTLAEHFYTECIGVEINELFYLINRYHVLWNHETNRNTKLYLGDSSDFLSKIFKEKSKTNDMWDEYTLIFLDAHWGPFNPLSKELKSISDYKLSPAAILIDDCYVDGDEVGLHDEDGEEYKDIPKRGKYQMETWLNQETDIYECAKHEYFEPMIDKIYGKGNYTTTFLDSERDVGMILYQPNKNHPRYKERLS